MLQQSETLKWRIFNRDYDLNSSIRLMGILNVTPDSFSDGGRFANVGAAIAHAKKMMAAGAHIIDVGGESTRPGAEPVDEKVERQRILPVIRQIASWDEVKISVDTYKYDVAKAALDAGAQIVNDITGGRFDSRMFGLVARTGAGFIMMHMQGMPSNMQIDPAYTHVIDDIQAAFEVGLSNAREAGVVAEQIVLDPGIGFGKNCSHNLQILKALPEFFRLGRPLVIGASRKSFIDKIIPAPVTNRLPGSIAAALAAIQRGVRILRVHDVGATRQAVAVWERIEGA